MIRVGLDAHVLGRRQSGNETYMRALTRALASEPDVDLVLYVDRDAVLSLPAGRAHVRRLAFRRAQPRIALELPLRARMDRLDLLHVQYVVPPVASVPVVTTVHDVSFLDVPDLLPRARRLRLQATVAFAVRRSAMIVTPSTFSRDRLLHHYAIPPERVVTVSPFLDSASAAEPPDAAADAPADAAQVASLQLPARFVLAVGEIQPRKNLVRLIEAMALARRRGLDAGLVIAGQPGWRADEVSQAIERNAAASWVRTLGYVSPRALGALYRAAWILAFVSLYEGFGLPVLEAMAAGTPVLAGRAGSIPEVADDGALLVDPIDPRAIADALADVASDDGLRQSLIAAGLQRAQHYRSETNARTIIGAYERALGR